MASAGFAGELDAVGTVGDAAALLGDPLRAAELRPDVTAVTELTPGPEAAAAFQLIESSRRGPLAFALVELVDLVAVDPGPDSARIVTRSRRAPGVRVWTETVLVQRGDRVRGRIAVTVSAPGPLLAATVEVLRARQTRELARAAALLEGRDPEAAVAALTPAPPAPPA